MELLEPDEALATLEEARGAPERGNGRVVLVIGEPGTILLAGAPTGDVTAWAGHRLLDKIVGCAIALVATYVLWPRDREVKEPVPVAAAT